MDDTFHADRTRTKYYNCTLTISIIFYGFSCNLFWVDDKLMNTWDAALHQFRIWKEFYIFHRIFMKCFILRLSITLLEYKRIAKSLNKNPNSVINHSRGQKKWLLFLNFTHYNNNENKSLMWIYIAYRLLEKKIFCVTVTRVPCST